MNAINTSDKGDSFKRQDSLSQSMNFKTLLGGNKSSTSSEKIRADSILNGETKKTINFK
jgi:hypothetical protein